MKKKSTQKCSFCKSKDITILSAGEVLCNNKKCLRLSMPEEVSKDASKVTKKGICCLCKKKYNNYGHNAEPLASGRCCSDCNIDVIAERLRIFKEGKDYKEGVRNEK